VKHLGAEKTSRLGSRDPVASRVKCEPHGGKNGKMKSWTVSWLSLKTKVELGLCGSHVKSGDWRRLNRVCVVFRGSPLNHWVPWLIHKAKAKDQMQQHQAGLTGVQRRSPETSKRRTRVRIAWLASRLSKFAVAGHPFDGAKTKIPKVPLGGVYPSVRL
jgi:hypothetical protein